MAEKKIPELLMPDVLYRVGLGAGPTEIRNWLLKDHGISISENALRKRLNKVKVERGIIAKAVTADKLKGTVVRDLDAIEGIIQRSLMDELKARALAWGEDQYAADGTTIIVEAQPKDVAGNILQKPPIHSGSEEWSRLMHTVRTSRRDLMDALDLRLELSGAEAGKGKADGKEARERLLAKIDKLLPMDKVPEEVTTTSVH